MSHTIHQRSIHQQSIHQQSIHQNIVMTSRSSRWFFPAALAFCLLVGCSGTDTPAKQDADSTSQQQKEKGHEHEGEANSGEHEGHEHGDEHEGHEHGDEHGSEITLTPAAMKEAGIVVEPAQRQPVNAVVTAPGRVMPTQDGVAHVGPVIAGRVTKLFVKEGDHVRAGTPLAELEAFDVSNLKGEYLQARAELAKAEATLARQRQLVSDGVGSKKNLEEAESAWGLATAAAKSTTARLRSLGINPEKISEETAFNPRILLRSPIAGVVAQRDVALGEYVEPSKDAFQVVNTNVVWADAQVPPAVAGEITVGRTGFVRDADGHRHAGRIIFIAPTVNPDSRTVTVRVAVDNPNVHMRPETFVTVEFERPVGTTALSVPADALEQQGGEYFLYREHEPGTFERVQVEVESQVAGKAIIRAGIAEGERVAVKGVFYLKSQRQKGELQEHHH